jgi:hypothetical protein
LNYWTQNPDASLLERFTDSNASPPGIDHHLPRYQNELHELLNEAGITQGSGLSGQYRQEMIQQLIDLQNGEDINPYSVGERIREIANATADIPFVVGSALITGLSGMDITTGSSIGWISWNQGGGFHWGEVTGAERFVAGSMLFLPVARGGSMIDNVANSGMRVGGTGLADDAFRLAKHGDMPSPRLGQQSHHGAMSAWMKKHFDGYDANKAPAILMPEANHHATFAVYNTWRAEMRQRMGGTFDWQNVSEAEMRALSEQMFDAARVPSVMRQDYWLWFEHMKSALRK